MSCCCLRNRLQKQGKKGFTLMEMLIVVAIIAVLIAIAIPVFMGQLENSRESTDAANLRSAYAEVMACALTETGNDNVTKGTNVYTAQVDATQLESNWKNDGLINNTIGGLKISNTTGTGYVNAATDGNHWEVSYNAETGTAKIEVKTGKASAASGSQTGNTDNGGN